MYKKKFIFLIVFVLIPLVAMSQGKIELPRTKAPVKKEASKPKTPSNHSGKKAKPRAKSQNKSTKKNKTNNNSTSNPSKQTSPGVNSSPKAKVPQTQPTQPTKRSNNSVNNSQNSKNPNTNNSPSRQQPTKPYHPSGSVQQSRDVEPNKPNQSSPGNNSNKKQEAVSKDYSPKEESRKPVTNSSASNENKQKSYRSRSAFSEKLGDLWYDIRNDFEPEKLKLGIGCFSFVLGKATSDGELYVNLDGGLRLRYGTWETRFQPSIGLNFGVGMVADHSEEELTRGFYDDDDDDDDDGYLKGKPRFYLPLDIQAKLNLFKPTDESWVFIDAKLIGYLYRNKDYQRPFAWSVGVGLAGETMEGSLYFKREFGTYTGHYPEYYKNYKPWGIGITITYFIGFKDDD